MSYASAASKGLGPAFSPTAPANAPFKPPPLAVAREDCYVLKHPSTLTLGQVALALQDQYPDLASKIQPFLQDGNVFLQLHKGVDASSLVAKGLGLNNVVASVKPLINSSKANFVQARLSGLLLDAHGVATAKHALGAFGKVLAWEEQHFPGTQVKSGEVHLLLDLGEGKEVPPALMKIDRDTWTEEVRFSVLGKATFCHYCRSISHTRPACTEAPACKTCSSHAHADAFCPKKKAQDRQQEAPERVTLGKRQRRSQAPEPKVPSTPLQPKTPTQKRNQPFTFTPPIDVSTRWADLPAEDSSLPELPQDFISSSSPTTAPNTVPQQAPGPSGSMETDQ